MTWCYPVSTEHLLGPLYSPWIPPPQDLPTTSRQVLGGVGPLWSPKDADTVTNSNVQGHSIRHRAADPQTAQVCGCHQEQMGSGVPTDHSDREANRNCKHESTWSSTNGPQENFGSLWHAVACCGMLQAVGQGYHHFPKAAQVSKTRPKHSESHALTPCKCQHC